MDRKTPVIVFAVFVAIFDASQGFQWKTQDLDVNACVGGRATLNFDFERDYSDQLEKIYWYGHGQMIASWFRNSFQAPPDGSKKFERLREVPGKEAAVQIHPVEFKDAGFYEVHIEVQGKDDLDDPVLQKYNASGFLAVGEAPEGELRMNLEESDSDACALKRQLSLSCGPFVKLGVPRVSVEWTNPAGEVMPSSRYENDRFYLDLPRKALPGNYSCRLACRAHVLNCIPAESPLRRPSVLHVSRDVTSRESCSDSEWVLPPEAEVGSPEFLTNNITDLQDSLELLKTEKYDQDQKLKRLEGTVDELRDQCNQVEDLRKELQDLKDDVQNLGNITSGRWQQTGRPSVPAETDLPDPLLKNLTQTDVIHAPPDQNSGTTLRSLIMTDDNMFVAGNEDKNELYIQQGSRLEPVQYGNKVHALTQLPNGKLAVTVDTNYILVAEFTGINSPLEQKWLFAERIYAGCAARSDDTLYAGARPDSYSGARIDIVSLRGDQAQVLSTVLTHEATGDLQCPDSLTLHDNDLYISDWCSNKVIVLHLETTKFDVLEGPPYRGDLQFYQPRQSAFDRSGNMYLATGGSVCDYHGDGHYSRGFCVVLITKDGGFKKVLEEGRDIYPYGVTATSSGIAVSWVTHTDWPHRSYIKTYTLQL